MLFLVSRGCAGITSEDIMRDIEIRNRLNNLTPEQIREITDESKRLDEERAAEAARINSVMQ